MVQPRNASSEIIRLGAEETSMRREGDVNGAPFAVAVAVEERLVSIRSRALSKPEFEAKLNITRAGCAGKLAERRGTDGGAGSAEIRVIERVEKLGSEFE